MDNVIITDKPFYRDGGQGASMHGPLSESLCHELEVKDHERELDNPKPLLTPPLPGQLWV